MEKSPENAGPAAPLKLFGSWASSYTHRVQLALRLKGLEFEYAEEDLGSKSGELLRPPAACCSSLMLGGLIGESKEVAHARLDALLRAL